MRPVFEQELNAVYQELTALANSANESLHKAVLAYQNDDKELAHELFTDDLRINASTADIEKSAYRIIALQQPVAKDLRLLFTVLYCSHDIERIADHAVSIARATLRMDDAFTSIESINEIISKMAKIVEEMLTNAINAFMDKDAKAARKIAEQDETIDLLLKELFQIAISNMESSTEFVNSGISYIGVGRNLERIADYITNICERIVYLTTGEFVELN
ncbi:TPA: phosphate signaling complex protein PhoU [Streptococcus suis]